MKQEDFDRIEHYIKGECDDNEKAHVESLFLNGEANSTLQLLLEKDWDNMNEGTSSSEVDLGRLLDHVHHIILKNETLKKKKPLQKFIRIYMRVAAILLLPLIVSGDLVYGYLGHHGKTTTDRPVSSTINAHMGARVSFDLPDGTTGMLNSGSSLTYSLPFSNNRKVTLEGEAWFKVSRDENHPFEVNIANSVVKVLGTSFNVSAYPSENYIEIVLQEGKVEFQNNKDNEIVTMLPSERLVFRDGKVCKSVTDPAKYNAWTEGKLVFRGDSMTDVAHQIERWYNVKVYFADRELERYSFHATFLDDTLEEVLWCLSMTSPISYKISPRELMQDGTYKKEEVTIFKKK